MVDLGWIKYDGYFLSQSNPFRIISMSQDGAAVTKVMRLNVSIALSNEKIIYTYAIPDYVISEPALPTRSDVSALMEQIVANGKKLTTDTFKIMVHGYYEDRTTFKLDKYYSQTLMPKITLDIDTPTTREDVAYLKTKAVCDFRTDICTAAYQYTYINYPNNKVQGTQFTFMSDGYIQQPYNTNFGKSIFMLNYSLPSIPIEIDCKLMVNNVEMNDFVTDTINVLVPTYKLTKDLILTPNNVAIPSDDHRDVFKNTYVYSYSGVDTQCIGAGYDTTYCMYDQYQQPNVVFRVYAIDISGATPNKLLYEYTRTDDYSRDFNYSIPLSQLTGLSYYINGCTLRLRVTITDERGFMDGYTRDIKIEQYTKPQLQLTQIGRCVDDGTYNDEGTCIGIETIETRASVNNLNKIDTYIYEYKEKGTEYYSSGDDLVSGSKVVSGSYFDMNKAYDVKLTLTDYIGNTITLIADIATSNAIIDIMMGGNGMALGMMASVEDALEIGYPNTNIRDGALNIKKFVDGGSVNLRIAPGSLNYAQYETDSKYGHYFLNPVYIKGDITTPNRLVSSEFGIGTPPPAFTDCLDVDLGGKTSGRIDRIILTDASEDYNCPIDSGQFIANRITFGGISQTNSMVTVILYEIKPKPYRIWINSYYGGAWLGWEESGQSTNNYSTTEIKTNDTWIDGKPIYRKTFQGDGANKTSVSLNVSTGLSGISSVWIDYSHSYWQIRNNARNSGLMEIANVKNATTGSANGTNQGAAYIVPNSGSPIIKIESGGNLQVNKYYITLLYTKTTD